MATSKSNNFEDYLKNHTAVKGTTFTNTRIGDKDLNIYGGSYTIPPTEWKEFMKKYRKDPENVFRENKFKILSSINKTSDYKASLKTLEKYNITYIRNGVNT